jgi:hypothetical protein
MNDYEIIFYPIVTTEGVAPCNPLWTAFYRFYPFCPKN